MQRIGIGRGRLPSKVCAVQPSRGTLPSVPSAVWGLLALLALFASARPAHGQVWVDMNQLDGKLPSWVDPAYVKPVPAPPQSPPERIVYRHWVEPVVRVICERVWIDARYAWRETIVWECGERIIRCERVCLEPAHWETRRREIVVRPGYWEETIVPDALRR